MNDFTKEELVILKRLTLQHVNQFRENSDCIELMSKIQSMIDNDCKHEFISSRESKLPAKISLSGKEFTYTNVVWSKAKCRKCGRSLNE